MIPYRADGKAPLPGLILLLLVTVVGGVAAGAAAYFVSTLIYLIVIFPLIMIFVGTVLVNFGIKQGKIRNRSVAFLFGLLVAVLIYGGYRYGEYLGFRQEIFNYAVDEAGSDLEPAEIEALIDQLLIEETGDAGFIGFTRLAAKEGVDINFGRSSSSGVPVHLDETMTWIYWALETLAILIITPLTVMSTAAEPFCSDCNRWYDSANKREYIGSIPAQVAEQFKQQMEVNNVRAAARLVNTRPGNSGDFHLFASHCGDCTEASVLLRAITRITRGRNTSESEHFAGLVQPMYMNELIRQVQANATNDQAAASTAA